MREARPPIAIVRGFSDQLERIKAHCRSLFHSPGRSDTSAGAASGFMPELNVALKDFRCAPKSRPLPGLSGRARAAADVLEQGLLALNAMAYPVMPQAATDAAPHQRHNALGTARGSSRAPGVAPAPSAAAGQQTRMAMRSRQKAIAFQVHLLLQMTLVEKDQQLYRLFPNEDDMGFWRVLMAGPPDSLYRGGVYELHIRFPDGFPAESPEVLLDFRKCVCLSLDLF